MQVKFQMMLEKALSERIDDWRFANRVGTRASAIRQLVEKGLEASASSPTSEASAGQQA